MTRAKERPVLFSGPMIRALLAGTKTQTRRVMRDIPAEAEGPFEAAMAPGSGPLWGHWAMKFGGKLNRVRCPFGVVGDRLWVKETWGLRAYHDLTDWDRESVRGLDEDAVRSAWLVEYRTDWPQDFADAHWRPSIFLPRWASRITLEVVSVRVERLQDISEEDAKSEGVERVGLPSDRRPLWQVGHEQHESARAAFSALWASINGAESWELNPWVWVVEFKRAESDAKRGAA